MSWKEATPAGGEDTSSRRSIAHFCPHEGCNGHDPQHFRSNKTVLKDTTFLEEVVTFSYRTIGREERLRYPVATFREFNLFINRMANRQASGEDKMPAELFKKAREIFRKQMMTIVNLILTGHYKCKPVDLEAKVILTCKDASNQKEGKTIANAKAHTAKARTAKSRGLTAACKGDDAFALDEQDLQVEGAVHTIQRNGNY